MIIWLAFPENADFYILGIYIYKESILDSSYFCNIILTRLKSPQTNYLTKMKVFQLQRKLFWYKTFCTIYS